MNAALKDEPVRRGVNSRTAAGLAVWGNWYIQRTSHEFGWGSQWAVLNYYGLLSAGHKVLFDTPEHVRVVDVAVGQIHELLRNSLVLRYWWHRDAKSGEVITEKQRAEALEMSSASQFAEVVRTAKLLVEKQLETLDYRRRNAKIE